MRALVLVARLSGAARASGASAARRARSARRASAIPPAQISTRALGAGGALGRDRLRSPSTNPASIVDVGRLGALLPGGAGVPAPHERQRRLAAERRSRATRSPRWRADPPEPLRRHQRLQLARPHASRRRARRTHADRRHDASRRRTPSRATARSATCALALAWAPTSLAAPRRRRRTRSRATTA